MVNYGLVNYLEHILTRRFAWHRWLVHHHVGQRERERESIPFRTFIRWMSLIAIIHLPKWITINTLLPLRATINNSTINRSGWETHPRRRHILPGQPVAIHKSKSRNKFFNAIAEWFTNVVSYSDSHLGTIKSFCSSKRSSPMQRDPLNPSETYLARLTMKLQLSTNRNRALECAPTK